MGELLQHDTSYHLWSPLAQTKWYLITTIDDHSRRILYGDLWEKETTWTHILAQKAVLTQFGCPLTYYVDNHSLRPMLSVDEGVQADGATIGSY